MKCDNKYLLFTMPIGHWRLSWAITSPAPPIQVQATLVTWTSLTRINVKLKWLITVFWLLSCETLWHCDYLWPYLSHTNSSWVHLTCLDPFKAKKKFVWWVGGGWVKTKNRVMLRSKSLSFEFSELDFAWLWPWPSWPSPDLHLISTWTWARQ